MTLLTSILVFLITFVKSILDLFISPYIFKKDLNHMKAVDAAQRKRSRDHKSTTFIFVLIAFISAINLWDSVMNNTTKDIEVLQKKVEKIESVLFPPNGSPSISAQLDEVVQSIEELKMEMVLIVENKAEKEDVDKVFEILAKMQLTFTTMKESENTRVMMAGDR